MECKHVTQGFSSVLNRTKSLSFFNRFGILISVYLYPDKWYNEGVMRRSIKPVVVYFFFLLVIGGLIFLDHQHHRQADVQVEKTEKTTQTSETDKEKVVEDRLAKMTLEEKVGQLFWGQSSCRSSNRRSQVLSFVWLYLIWTRF